MAQAYLKIENPGVAPLEAFTLLGASSKRNNTNNRIVGHFGSGNKFGPVVCLRNNLFPVVYRGLHCLEYQVKNGQMDDGICKTEIQQVSIKYSGKTEDGKTSSKTQDLGFVLDYGSSDWLGLDLALREFVSNAIDRAVQEGELNFILQWLEKNHINNIDNITAGERASCEQAVEEYRKTATDFRDVSVEVVNENQVRGKRDHTRIFVPLNDEVLEFYNNLGKWFLHFSEPENLDRTILPKKDRNFNGRQAAVIYRRGVRVREFESDETPSLFDYNLPHIKLDESRQVDDWKVRQAAGQALAASPEGLCEWFLTFYNPDKKYWESGFDTYCLDPIYAQADKKTRGEIWQKSWEKVAGENGVLTSTATCDMVSKKGYKPIVVSQDVVAVAGSLGVRTANTILTEDEKTGKEVLEATPDAQAALDFCWDLVTKVGMTNGKARPGVKVFRKIMSACQQVLGYYREGVVYLNVDLAGYASLEGGQAALSNALLQTCLEEVGHHITGATDGSRDFQDWAFGVAMKAGKLSAGLL